MKTFLLTTCLALSFSAIAHEDHDWREDYTAFLSVNYKFPQALKMNGVAALQIPAARRVDMAFFKAKLSILAGETPFVSADGTSTIITERKSNKNLDLTRAFLKSEYEKLGFTVAFQPFASGSNFIAEKLGTTSPDKVLILSSHIDSVGNKGANDDGSGTIGLLMVSKELAKKNYGSTIRVLGFDREETGLRGSDAYVATIARKESIIGNINFEMMGTNSRNDGAFHVIDCNKQNSLFLSEAISTSITSLGLNLMVVEACTDRSDHASFWRKKMPAVVISENFFGGDGDPCYHAKCDVMDERLKYDYMGNIMEATLAATEKILK